MIKLIQDKSGWTFAVLKDDTHLSKWSQEQRSLVTDQVVPRVLVPLIKPGDTVVDVGACLGDHTVAYSHAVGPTGKVYAFEPYLPSYVCLAVNCRDLPQTVLYNNGLASKEFHTLLMPDIKNAGATHVYPTHSHTADTLLQSLDSYGLKACNFIKIDVEGFEPHVIRGAMGTIEQFRPLIYIELNDGCLARYGFTKKDVLTPLTSMGYTINFIDPNHNLQMPQVDALLIP